jgi:hypothetical protein
MWFKKAMFYVCLLTGSALALAMAGKSSRQNSSKATEAPSGYDNHPQSSNAWALSKKLSLRQVQSNPSSYNVKDNPSWRSPCAL